MDKRCLWFIQMRQWRAELRWSEFTWFSRKNQPSSSVLGCKTGSDCLHRFRFRSRMGAGQPQSRWLEKFGFNLLCWRGRSPCAPAGKSGFCSKVLRPPKRGSIHIDLQTRPDFAVALRMEACFYRNRGFWWYCDPHPMKGKDRSRSEHRPGRQKMPVRSGLDKPSSSLLKSINSS
jgi:hypothetical protein